MMYCWLREYEWWLCYSFFLIFMCFHYTFGEDNMYWSEDDSIHYVRGWCWTWWLLLPLICCCCYYPRETKSSCHVVDGDYVSACSLVLQHYFVVVDWESVLSYDMLLLQKWVMDVDTCKLVPSFLRWALFHWCQWGSEWGSFSWPNSGWHQCQKGILLALMLWWVVWLVLMPA